MSARPTTVTHIFIQEHRRTAKLAFHNHLLALSARNDDESRAFRRLLKFIKNIIDLDIAHQDGLLNLAALSVSEVSRTNSASRGKRYSTSSNFQNGLSSKGSRPQSAITPASNGTSPTVCEENGSISGKSTPGIASVGSFSNSGDVHGEGASSSSPMLFQKAVCAADGDSPTSPSFSGTENENELRTDPKSLSVSTSSICKYSRSPVAGYSPSLQLSPASLMATNDDGEILEKISESLSQISLEVKEACESFISDVWKPFWSFNEMRCKMNKRLLDVLQSFHADLLDLITNVEARYRSYCDAYLNYLKTQKRYADALAGNKSVISAVTNVFRSEAEKKKAIERDFQQARGVMCCKRIAYLNALVDSNVAQSHYAECDLPRLREGLEGNFHEHYAKLWNRYRSFVENSGSTMQRAYSQAIQSYEIGTKEQLDERFFGGERRNAVVFTPVMLDFIPCENDSVEKAGANEETIKVFTQVLEVLASKRETLKKTIRDASLRISGIEKLIGTYNDNPSFGDAESTQFSKQEQQVEFLKAERELKRVEAKVRMLTSIGFSEAIAAHPDEECHSGSSDSTDSGPNTLAGNKDIGLEQGADPASRSPDSKNATDCSITGNEKVIRALYDYHAANEDEISLKAGQSYSVVETEVIDEGWFRIQDADGNIGYAPGNYFSTAAISEDAYASSGVAEAASSLSKDTADVTTASEKAAGSFCNGLGSGADSLRSNDQSDGGKVRIARQSHEGQDEQELSFQSGDRILPIECKIGGEAGDSTAPDRQLWLGKNLESGKTGLFLQAQTRAAEDAE